MNRALPILLAASVACCSGCKEKQPAAPATAAVHHHEHKPPHHGTPVVLGHEEYHLELVLDAPAGKLQAYVLDGEMENFIRIQDPSFAVQVKLPAGTQTLIFKAIPNSATGEKIGDTSMFEAQAGWLSTNSAFDAVLTGLTVKGQKYQQIPFNFPKGNDTDEK